MNHVTTILVGGGLHGEEFSDFHQIERDTISLFSKRKAIGVHDFGHFGESGNITRATIGNVMGPGSGQANVYEIRECRFCVQDQGDNFNREPIECTVLAEQSIRENALAGLVEDAIAIACFRTKRNVRIETGKMIELLPGE